MAPPNPLTVKAIFKEYRARRRAILDALTLDVTEFYDYCDPDNQAGAILLFGLPNGKWRATTSEVEFPPPHPTAGINLVRDEMNPKDWLSFVARHCGAWLLSVTFFAADHLDGDGRNKLFSMINRLPTLTEEVARRNYVPDGEKIYMKPRGDPEQDNDLCGFCGNNGYSDNKWVRCDVCQKWYHCICENIAPEVADNIDKYVCHACPKPKKRRARPKPKKRRRSFRA